MLPDRDGAAAKRVLPEWAEELTRSCDRYTFTTMQVHTGRAVVATKSGDGTGPLLVITSNEAEMRKALGLKLRKPPK
jgi:hypothetical protein